MSEDPVAASDQLDQKILTAPIPKQSYLVEALFFILVLLMVVGFGGMFFQLNSVNQQTREVVQHEVPALQVQLAEKNADIADLKGRLDRTGQIIVRLSDEVIRRGGNPVPLVVPPTPTTVPSGR